MKVLLVGLGMCGYGWFKALSGRKNIVLSGIADTDPQTHRKIKTESYVCKFFTDAKKAMDDIMPDYIVNAAPPKAHAAINFAAFKRNIPVICEKPISDNFKSALKIFECAKSGNKIMIAENYRYLGNNRFVKDFLDKQPIGNLSGIKIDFNVNCADISYHKKMKYPILIDIGVHHLDLLRFFTGAEGSLVYADFYKREKSRSGFTGASLRIVMDNGVKADYNANMAADGNITAWNGTWLFEGKDGTLKYEGSKLYLHTSDGKKTVVSVPDCTISDKELMLDEVEAYLKGGKVPQTDISDNIKTFAIARAAQESFENKEETICR